jgi:hypothetical protein
VPDYYALTVGGGDVGLAFAAGRLYYAPAIGSGVVRLVFAEGDSLGCWMVRMIVKNCIL